MPELPARVTASGAGAVAVGRDVRGDLTVHHYAGRPPLSWPHRIGVVPPLAHGYQMRSESEALHRAFANDPGGTAVLMQVLAGMGGIGKTQLAAAYAHEQWQEAQVHLLMWVTASSRESVLTVYAQAAADLFDPPAEETVEQRADRFLVWLSTTPRPWLLVLDNLADPAELDGLWPTGPMGQVLVTTRRRDASLTRSGRTVVEVGLFTDQEARAYLTERLDPDGRRPDRLAGADELIADLDRLPLALAQAGSYMLDRDLSCGQYRRRLGKRRLELVFPDDAPADEYANTVAATARTVAVAWSLSTENANNLPPRELALPLLAMASVLSPDGFPTSLFSAPTALAFLSQRVAPDEGGGTEELVDVDDVHDALSNLHRLSLLTRSDTVRVHALVQRATRERLDEGTLDRATKAASESLLWIWPEQDSHPQHALLAQSLRINAMHLHGAASGHGGAPYDLLVMVGDSLSRIGHYQLAANHWTGLIEELVLEGRDRRSREVRARLAVAYRYLGEPEQALGIISSVLAEAEQKQDTDDAEILNLRTNLASCYRAIGNWSQAIPLLEAAADSRTLLAVEDMSDLCAVRNNLAGAYLDAGRLDEAVTLYEAILGEISSTFGAEATETVNARNNLAMGYTRAGRRDEASPLLEVNRDLAERLLGPTHPLTLMSLNNLAGAYRNAGRPGAAISLLTAVLTERQRTLGPRHPDTLITHRELGWAYTGMSDHASALPHFTRVAHHALLLPGIRRARPWESRHDLALCLMSLNRGAQAIPVLESIAAEQSAEQEPRHLVIATEHNLALAYAKAGQIEPALRILRRVAKETEEAHGRDEALTLTIRQSLAVTHFQAGRAGRSIKMMSAVIEDTRRVLGEDDLMLATRLDTLGHICAASGDTQAAHNMSREAAQIRAKKSRQEVDAHRAKVVGMEIAVAAPDAVARPDGGRDLFLGPA